MAAADNTSAVTPGRQRRVARKFTAAPVAPDSLQATTRSFVRASNNLELRRPVPLDRRAATPPSGFVRIVAMKRRGWRVGCVDLDGTSVLGDLGPQHLVHHFVRGARLDALAAPSAAQE